MRKLKGKGAVNIIINPKKVPLAFHPNLLTYIYFMLQ